MIRHGAATKRDVGRDTPEIEHAELVETAVRYSEIEVDQLPTLEPSILPAVTERRAAA